MGGSSASYPEIVFLRRHDRSGYGFFFHGMEDFRRAAESFTLPVLRSFAGEPVPGQPQPLDHLKTAIATLLGQAFDKAVPAECGAEGISRAAAAGVLDRFPGPVPRVVVLEQVLGRLRVRPGIEFMRHPGHPLAVVVDADTHGGEAHFFNNVTQYQAAGESQANAACWLPQIIYRLYATTPSVVAGRPLRDREDGDTVVECRGINFGLPAPLVERSAR